MNYSINLGTDPPGKLKNQIQRLLLIGSVLLLAFLVRAMLFNGGIRGSDAYAYAMHAYEIANGTYQLGHVGFHYGLRYAVLLPTALSYALFGVNDIASAFFPMVSSMLNIVLVFLIGERLFDHKTAFLASLLLAIYPLDIMYASLLSPDSLLPLFSSATILCYLMAMGKKTLRQNGPYYFLAGICVYLAFSARASGLVLFAVLLIHHLLRNMQKKTPLDIGFLGIVLSGVALSFIGEGLYYFSSTGDFLFRLHIVRSVAEELMPVDKSSLIALLLFYPLGMFGFTLQGLATYGFTWWLAFAGMLRALIKKDKAVLLLAVWLFTPLLGHIIITLIVPVVHTYGYLSIISPPAALLGAYFIGEAYKAFQKKHAIVILFVLTIASLNIYGAYRIGENIKDDAAPYIAVADYFKESPCQDIYVHHSRWPLFLNYFFGYNQCARFHDLKDYSKDDLEGLSDGYVILNPRYLDADINGQPLTHRPIVANYLNSPPALWEKVLSYMGRPAYNSVTIYEIHKQK